MKKGSDYHLPTKIRKLDKLDGNDAMISQVHDSLHYISLSHEAITYLNGYQKKRDLKQCPTETRSFSALYKPIYDANAWPVEQGDVVKTTLGDAAPLNSCCNPGEQTYKSVQSSTDSSCLNDPSCVRPCGSREQYFCFRSNVFNQPKRSSAAPIATSCPNAAPESSTPFLQHDICNTISSCQNSCRSTSTLNSILQETTRKLTLKMDKNKSSKNSDSRKYIKSPLSYNSFSTSRIEYPFQNATTDVPSHAGTHMNNVVEPGRVKTTRTTSVEELPSCICEERQNNINKQKSTTHTRTGKVNKLLPKGECDIRCWEDKLPTYQRATTSSQVSQFIGNLVSRYEADDLSTHLRTPNIKSTACIEENGASKRGLASDESEDEDLTRPYSKGSWEVVTERSRCGPYTRTCPANPDALSQCCSRCYSPDKPPWNDGHGCTRAMLKERYLAALRAYRARKYSDKIRRQNKIYLRSNSSGREDSEGRSCRAYTEFLGLLGREIIAFKSVSKTSVQSAPPSDVQSNQDAETLRRQDAQSNQDAETLRRQDTQSNQDAETFRRQDAQSNQDAETFRRQDAQSNQDAETLRRQDAQFNRVDKQMNTVICCSDDENCCSSVTSINIQRQEKKTEGQDAEDIYLKSSRREILSTKDEGSKNPSTQNFKRLELKENLYPTYHVTKMLPDRFYYRQKNGKGKTKHRYQYVFDSYNGSEVNSSTDDSEPKYHTNKNIMKKEASLIYESPLIDINNLRLPFPTKMYYSSKDNYPSTDSSISTEFLHRHGPQNYYEGKNYFNEESNGSSGSISINTGDNYKIIPIKLSISSETSLLAKRRRDKKDKELKFKYTEIDNHLKNITNNKQALFYDNKGTDSSKYSMVRKIFPRKKVNQQSFEKPNELGSLSQSMKVEIPLYNGKSQILNQYSSDKCSLEEPSYTRLINRGVEEKEYLTYYTDDVQTSTSDLHKLIWGDATKMSNQCNTSIALSSKDMLESGEGMNDSTLEHRNKRTKSRVLMVRNTSCNANMDSCSMVPSVDSSHHSIDEIKSVQFCSPSTNVVSRPNCDFQLFENNQESPKVASSSSTTRRTATKIVLAMNTSMEIACVQTDPSKSDEEFAHPNRETGKSQQNSETQTSIIKSRKDEYPKISRYMEWRRNYMKNSCKNINSDNVKNLAKNENRKISKTNCVKMRDARVTLCNIAHTPEHILKAGKPYFDERNVDAVPDTDESKFFEFIQSHQPGDNITLHRNKKHKDRTRTSITKHTRPDISGDFETQSTGETSSSMLQSTPPNKESCPNRIRLYGKRPKFSTFDRNKGKRIVNLSHSSGMKISEKFCFQLTPTIQPICSKIGKRRVDRSSSVNSSPTLKASRNKMRVRHRNGQSDSKYDIDSPTDSNKSNCQRNTQNELSTHDTRESIHRVTRSLRGRTFQKRHLQRIVIPKPIQRNKSHEIEIVNEGPKRHQKSPKVSRKK